ncbi:MAG: ester cyclase [Myxococcales bacterium]|nr:ester cyclase [Myxococcales bacterium]
MNREQAIEWCNRFYERVWHESDPEKFGAAIDELVSKDCVVIGLPRGENIARAGFRQFRMMFFRSLDRVRIVAQDCVTDGDRIAVRASFDAWRGDKHVTIPGSAMLEVRDGQIVEAFNHWDWLSLLEQFDAIPGNALVQTLERFAVDAEAKR